MDPMGNALSRPFGIAKTQPQSEKNGLDSPKLDFFLQLWVRHISWLSQKKQPLHNP